jgi:predicted ArsR family transcriptional regulator
MKQRLLQQVGRSARLRVLNELKRTQGLCVADLAERIGMSYMGAKGICLDLEKRGLLDTWRQPQKIGRPHLLYRLTERAQDLFPVESNTLTLDILEASRKLFGASAPDKLLLLVFQKKTEQYLAKLKGDTPAERAKWLARLRDHEGYMSECEAEPTGAVRIVEHHSPVLDILRQYPLVAKLEVDMFQRLVGTPVQREETAASGLYCATFRLLPNPSNSLFG